MTKKQMKDALIERIYQEYREGRITAVMVFDAITTLDQFEKVFELKKYAEESAGIKKYWYYTIGYSFAPVGYIHDIWLNQSTGKALFGDYAKFGTLTATLWRIKDAVPDGKGNYVHYKYGTISAYNYDLAMEICAVLNNYDKGHC